MLSKDQKKQIVKDLAEKIKSSKSVVFSDFKGLQVKDLTGLRKELRESQADFKVIKKTLLGIALKEAGIKMDTKKLEGQIAVTVSENDEVTPAKIIAKLAKGNENLKIIGGLLGEKEMNSEEMNALAKLPSKEELLARLVGSLKSPIFGLANVLVGNLRGLVQVLKARCESVANEKAN
ncbi:MAG TPA: 50S ribosomal protein L10 [Candidatus Moranbacteria bacterium]|nr:50S ribosomal protein L10 [Candidatus Moranbacteria bacterium]